ncbi:MAG: NAD-dependent epimerase/dehydratase family protein [Acidimicrobiia bacterium]
MSFWTGRAVLVTGGASFIGSHLVEVLVTRGAHVRVIDDLSSGRRDNLAAVADDVDLQVGDLGDPDVAHRVCADREVVFHLAADHGGRGYVDLHQVACATNLGLDQTLFDACRAAGVGKIAFASSGCVYPMHLQTEPVDELYLSEDMVGPPYDPDGMYGLAKLAGELTLRALHSEDGMSTASCRYFTVYGPRGVENHAVMAMIARAFIGESPFAVWGTGEQIRNWTYVDDIVFGTVAAAEHIDDGTAVNLGTMERVRVLDAVELVFDYTGHRAPIETQPHMPIGPVNRVADNHLARKLLGWEPQVTFADGLRRTVDWYTATKDPEAVRASLGHLLTERPVSASAAS